MIYLTKDNLIALAYERFIDESTADFQQALDKIELQNIEIIKGYLGSLYDVNLIFDETQPIIHGMIVRILSQLVMYDVIRRNAARKVPEDYKEQYEKAMALLEKIAFGKFEVKDLPKPEHDDEDDHHQLWGNNSNPNFYI